MTNYHHVKGVTVQEGKTVWCKTWLHRKNNNVAHALFWENDCSIIKWRQWAGRCGEEWWWIIIQVGWGRRPSWHIWCCLLRNKGFPHCRCSGVVTNKGGCKLYVSWLRQLKKLSSVTSNVRCVRLTNIDDLKGSRKKHEKLPTNNHARYVGIYRLMPWKAYK